MDNRAGGFGQLPGLLEDPRTEGIPSRMGIEIAKIIDPNEETPPALSNLVACRAHMNMSSTPLNHYPSRFLDMHTDAGFGLHALTLSPVGSRTRELFGDQMRSSHLQLANGHAIPYHTISLNPDNIRCFTVRLPLRLGDLNHSILPDYAPDSYAQDVLFAQTLVVKQIHHMCLVPGIATQYVANLGTEDTFLDTFHSINHALSTPLTDDYAVYAADNGLTLPLTLGQMIYWFIATRSVDATCEYRLMLTFLAEISRTPALGNGALTRRLLESFRVWVNNSCSSCFMVSIIHMPVGREVYFPFNTSSVLDDPNKTYYIAPSYFHARQPPHAQEEDQSAATYWVSYPLFEHTFIYIAGNGAMATLLSGSGSFKIKLPSHQIITFDIVVTKLVRIVRAARAGRFFPLLHFFHSVTLEFTTMNRLIAAIGCLKAVLAVVPEMRGLIRNLITILYCGGIPRQLLSSPWTPEMDIHRESILRQISRVPPIYNPELATLVACLPLSSDFYRIVNDDRYAELMLCTLRSEYFAFTNGRVLL